MLTFSMRPLFLLFVTFWLMISPLAADPLPVMDELGITPDMIETRIKEAEANEGLSESARAAVLNDYRKVQTELEALQGLQKNLGSLEEKQQSALKEVERLRSQLAEVPKKQSLKSLGIDNKIPLEALEQILLKEQTRRSAAQTALAEVDDEIENQLIRPKEVQQRRAMLKAELDQVGQALSAPPDTSLDSAHQDAAQWAYRITRQRLQLEIQTLDQELLGMPVRQQLLQLRRDKLARDLASASEGVALLQDYVTQQRQAAMSEDLAKVKAAQQDAASKHPLLRTLAETNTQLIQRIRQSVAAMAEIDTLINQHKAQLQQLESDFKSTRQKTEIAGLSVILGQVLFEERRGLMDAQKLRRSVAQREELTADIGLRQIRYIDERKALGNLGQAMAELLATVPEDQQPPMDELKTLMQSRKDLLDKTVAVEGDYLRRLVELDYTERQLIELISNYEQFLTEHLLWIRSVQPFSLDIVASLPVEVKDILTPHRWRAFLDNAWGQMQANAMQTPLLLLVILLFWQMPRWRRDVLESGNLVNDFIRDCFVYTLRALLVTLLRAATWPLLMAILGWLLQQGPNAAGVQWLSHYLLLLAPTLLMLRFCWLLCEPKGIAERHFHWPRQSVRLLQRQTRWLILVIMVTVLVVMMSSPQALGHETMGVSRLAFILMLLGLGHFLARVFSLKTGVLVPLMQRNPNGVMNRTRYLWYALAVGVPLVLAGMSLIGYYYTAGMLMRSLFYSLLYILALVVAHETIMRWFLTRLKQARRTAMAERMAARQETAEVVGEETGLPPVEEEALDLEAIDQQSRKLLHIFIQLAFLLGLWGIWSAVLPAFSLFTKVVLWQQTLTVGDQKILESVTLDDLLLALIVAVVTAVAARSLPSVINILMMKRLAVNSGTRYAYQALTQYAVIGVGLAFIFSLVGGSWSEIQWLVAALGVGIGFGLQEIIANFISGLIILFERPVRVGDVVTVGETTGVVSRIRIRATTITNYDRKELLVPNKEFITGRLLNWSLSDSVTRIGIPIGIAYGSDVALALSLLAEVAAKSDRVLAEPEPQISFDSFGDNTLNLMMRCYLASADHRIRVISELNLAINAKFEAAGISIAYPQRDVHLDTSTPLEVRIAST